MKGMIAGFFASWLVYAFILILHVILPARRVHGYLREAGSGEALSYRLNGPLVLVLTVGLWVVIGVLGLAPWDWLYVSRWASVLGACVLGIGLSLAMVLPEKSRDMPLVGTIYKGISANPRFFGGRLDAKMWLYLAGAVMLALNILSFLAHRVMSFGWQASGAELLYGALFLWFVVDYLVFEQVHLYTYDLFAENLGFKLIWGCLAFYPYFYPIGLWATALSAEPTIPAWLSALSILLFFTGWILSRGANMQKYLFKTSPDRALLGIIKPEPITDGEHALLSGGFWGVSRHVNYLGEIVMATGLTLALGRPASWLTWLYPLYYIALLFPRERADDRRCAAKYGALWEEYVRRVPRHIIPGLY